ncbi:hypothetical protein BDK51DRAFT_38920 [Blyttiomyces helicus]|uniref:Uncharacterized protein n=1 Tax=Blyttiomyces helicus TaxID=388810 RepID=A0A4V1ISG4_9FUNG|nr:hypothetical protein BDK51DRAFT_38920 [Blyttiomyces helicus]|eukprot:RKO93467.1 hypothetical protein BDK51DRAFT_38920 [Blyttiomyces helicus]
MNTPCHYDDGCTSTYNVPFAKATPPPNVAPIVTTATIPPPLLVVPMSASSMIPTPLLTTTFLTLLYHVLYLHLKKAPEIAYEMCSRFHHFMDDPQCSSLAVSQPSPEKLMWTASSSWTPTRSKITRPKMCFLRLIASTRFGSSTPHRVPTSCAPSTKPANHLLIPCTRKTSNTTHRQTSQIQTYGANGSDHRSAFPICSAIDIQTTPDCPPVLPQLSTTCLNPFLLQTISYTKPSKASGRRSKASAQSAPSINASKIFKSRSSKTCSSSSPPILPSPSDTHPLPAADPSTSSNVANPPAALSSSSSSITDPPLQNLIPDLVQTSLSISRFFYNTFNKANDKWHPRAMLEKQEHAPPQLAHHRSPPTRHPRLVHKPVPGSFTFCKGMPFTNMENNLGRNIGLANGTQLFAERIICERRKPPTPSIHGPLKYLPAGLVVRAPSLEMIDANLKRKSIKVGDLEESLFVQPQRRSIAPTLAMTNYKSQGLTLEQPILDLPTPQGPFDPNSTYVELSRSNEPEGTAILPNMEPKILDLPTPKEVDIPRALLHLRPLIPSTKLRLQRSQHPSYLPIRRTALPTPNRHSYPNADHLGRLRPGQSPDPYRGFEGGRKLPLLRLCPPALHRRDLKPPPQLRSLDKL